MIRKRAMWLLFTVLTATASGQSMDVTYTTHVDGVVTGFDPFCINSFIQPDPGLRSTIFQPLRNPIHSTEDEVIVNKFINAAESVKCFPVLTIQTITNYIELHKYAASSTYHISSAVNYASPEVRHGNSAACETQNHTRDHALRQFFEDTGGEVMLVSAECVTHTISINPFEPVLFTPAFETALARLYEAALSPASEVSDRTFTDFVWSYGTHFSKRSQLGARAVLGKLFPSHSATAVEQTARRRCVFEAAREALTPCMRRCNETTLTHFERAASEKCGDTEHQVLALITGPLPVISIENWASTAEELPDPIYHYLEPISTLFTREWSSTDAETNKINKTTVHNFFVKKLADYSSSMFPGGLDQGRTSINQDYSSSMFPGGLDQGRTSINQDYSSSMFPGGLDQGRTSGGVAEYGGVVIIGGFGVSITSETLGSPELPPFPGTVYDNTVSIVGSTVFSCGGWIEEYSQACYSLRAREPTWRSIVLPWPLDGHSAVTVQDTTIWFLRGSALYSYDTAKDNDQFRTYSLSFINTRRFCTVTNHSHTFVIGVGEDWDEVRVNRDPSKPTEWDQVAQLVGQRNSHACLWFGSEIFVTGGRHDNVAVDTVEVLNLVDMTCRSTGPLVHARHGHKMAVLHGKPAVLGGEVGVNFDASIEVYEFKTGTWQTLNYSLEVGRFRFGLAQYRP